MIHHIVFPRREFLAVILQSFSAFLQMYTNNCIPQSVQNLLHDNSLVFFTFLYSPLVAGLCKLDNAAGGTMITLLTEVSSRRK
jgi:hypothetical protein